ncbi:MAG: hypothetical protein U0234_31820 [Sandaracinus sp.]
MRTLAWTMALVGSGAFGVGCALANPTPHGGPRDAGMDGMAADAVVPGTDAHPGVDAHVPGVDAFVPPNDAWSTTPNDAWTAPNDAFVPGTGRYLDRCTTAANCAGGAPCTLDRGGTRFCTRACTTDAQCAHEHTCVGGFCVPDDVGAACTTGTPDVCIHGLCLGTSDGGYCTRFCNNASECPSGYACSRSGGSSQKICVNIETNCTAGGSECPPATSTGTGYCTTFGCTTECDTAADCPMRLPGSPAYLCNRSLNPAGNALCIPPADIFGGDPIGAPCVPSGLNTCRSGACDTTAVGGPTCVQACGPQGGCPPSSGCRTPVDDTLLVCEQAGVLDLTATCAHGYECLSAICIQSPTGTGPSHCSRICNDGLCPTGTTCQSTGVGFSVCVWP